MSSKTTANLDSKIFDRAAIERMVAQVVVNTAKDFKQSTIDEMEDSPHTGRTTSRRDASGTTRQHQASRRGERPAPDSRNLAEAIVDRRTGKFEVTVEIDESKAPYGNLLQEKRGRKIMTEDDARIAERVMVNRSNQAIRNLL